MNCYFFHSFALEKIHELAQNLKTVKLKIILFYLLYFFLINFEIKMKIVLVFSKIEIVVFQVLNNNDIFLDVPDKKLKFGLYTLI